jgi:hypothetical protein
MAGNLERRGHSGGLGVDGDNIKMNFKKIDCKGVEWIHLAQDSDLWRVLVNTVQYP